MDAFTKFILTILTISLATAGGYFARRLRIVPEKASHPLMTFIAVVGYPSVGFLAIWKLSPTVSDLVLPGLAMLQLLILAAICIPLSRLFTKNPPQRGLFAIASIAGNWAYTMGGFVAFVIYRAEGLGLASLYCMVFTPGLVFVYYPIARHFTSSKQDDITLGRLMLRSLFDIRSLGLAASVTALCLSLAGVPWPGSLDQLHIIDILMMIMIPLSYFSVGLGLHASHLWQLKKMIAGLAGTRFILSGLVAAALVAILGYTPWTLSEIARNVFYIEAVVPTAVAMVAVANMFNLRPREASALFVGNSLMYLVIVLPLVLWFFS